MKNYLFALTAMLLMLACQSQRKPLGLTEEEHDYMLKKAKESLVFVEGGTFTMGDVGKTYPSGYNRPFFDDPSSFPLHEVTLDSYYMQKYEITYGEFDLFTKAVGIDSIYSQFIGLNFRGPDGTATGMNWYEAQEYCEWLGDLVGVPMSLPTDAQWEYAARSRGQAVANATDDGTIDGGRNYYGKGVDIPKRETPSGYFPPNPLGLYDMSGGVGEWIFDYWYPFTEDPVTNPTCTDSTYHSNRITRGFPGPSGSIYPRTDNRKPTNRGSGVGMRCVANVTKDTIR
ncbi:formylglycine-generating enzyme family protein [Saccharicrinis aurantiacus]|uniref:formylglycine-generating enzyme family protein n=1 Tax=Saccharicrinis aurantiacus TaxID=1849719 RepID=UPI0009501797|nr:formylglycine-generating enzyme family protein [Saccharicrinis aurantiacus]